MYVLLYLKRLYVIFTTFYAYIYVNFCTYRNLNMLMLRRCNVGDLQLTDEERVLSTLTIMSRSHSSTTPELTPSVSAETSRCGSKAAHGWSRRECTWTQLHWVMFQSFDNRWKTTIPNSTSTAWITWSISVTLRLGIHFSSVDRTHSDNLHCILLAANHSTSVSPTSTIFRSSWVFHCIAFSPTTNRTVSRAVIHSVK